MARQLEICIFQLREKTVPFRFGAILIGLPNLINE
jgi:hypothetical protein